MADTVVRKNKKAGGSTFTGKTIAILLVLMVIFFAELFFDTWCGVQCLRTGYEISDASAQQEKLTDLQKKLNIELMRLQSPQALRSLAQQYGLSVPEPDHIVVMP